MPRILNSSIICLLVMFLTLFADERIVLRGVVVDNHDKKPVANAVVYIPEFKISGYTDENGIFEFVNLSPGKIYLQVIRLGYHEYSREVNLTDEKVVNLDIKLKQHPLQAEEILVTSTPYCLIPQTAIPAPDIGERYPKDIGVFLREYSEFGGIRKGGYATDPVMRGFKYDQLNVQYDGGVRVSCACPNRMDPITTHVPAEDLEKIEIIKGPYSVRFGQNIGGVINLVMKRPEPSEILKIQGTVEGGYESNGDGSRGRVGLSALGPFYSFYFSGATKDMGDYKNGSGVVVPSSYRVNDYSLKAGLFPFGNHHFQLSWRQSFARDVLHAGLPMDTKEDNTTLWSIDYNVRNLNSKLFSVTAKFYISDLNHIMDNLRRPNSSMVQAVSTVSSKSLGGKLELGTSFLMNSLWYFGADLYRIEKNGSRDRLVSVNPCNMMVFDPPRSFTDPVWQNSEWTNSGLFTEWRQTLRPNLTFIAGARVDFVSSLNKDPAPQFIEKYGNAGRLNEANFSASLTLNYDLNSTGNLKFAAGRGVRSANITERYINHLNIGQDPYEYVGNPGLAPEINNQIELSFKRRLYQWQLTGNIFYASINNFIMAAVNPDIDRLYMPCQEPKNAKQFLNINRATQTGFEFGLDGNITRTLIGRGTLGYTWSKNHEWNEPLPEIPPVEAKLAIRYNHIDERFWVEAEGRFAAQQNRISESFGETKTAAFSVYNLLAGYSPLHFFEIVTGIYNIFNKTYYEHLNRRYQNQITQSVVYEPGRNVFVILKLRV